MNLFAKLRRSYPPDLQDEAVQKVLKQPEQSYMDTAGSYLKKRNPPSEPLFLPLTPPASLLRRN